MSNRVCFIIAHKYYRGYESYLSYYISNIQELYPEALTIIVDNNSKYIEDVFGPLRDLDNVVLLSNDIESKFEMGAYTVGAQYVLDNDLVDQYSHFICTQDNFVIKNFYDFDKLKAYALPICSMYLGGDGYARDISDAVLTPLGLNNNWDKVDFCWCSSFILASSKLEKFHGYAKTIIQSIRRDSEAAERYLARILWELNEQRECGDIDGSCKDLHQRHYDCWKVDVRGLATSYFVKRVQQKNEHTRDQ